MKAAVEAFSNPFHDLYKAQIDSQLGDYYAQVENRLRQSFSDEFVRTDNISRYLFIAGSATVAGLFVLSRMPWGTLLNWCKYLLHR
jgi:hypothetical protein